MGKQTRTHTHTNGFVSSYLYTDTNTYACTYMYRYMHVHACTHTRVSEDAWNSWALMCIGEISLDLET